MKRTSPCWANQTLPEPHSCWTLSGKAAQFHSVFGVSLYMYNIDIFILIYKEKKGGKRNSIRRNHIFPFTNHLSLHWMGLLMTVWWSAAIYGLFPVRNKKARLIQFSPAMLSPSSWKRCKAYSREKKKRPLAVAPASEIRNGGNGHQWFESDRMKHCRDKQ